MPDTYLTLQKGFHEHYMFTDWLTSSPKHQHVQQPENNDFRKPVV